MAEKNAKPIRAAVVTMNPHEGAAVKDALNSSGWRMSASKGDAIGRLAIHVATWGSLNSPISLEHFDMDSSGNITAAMLAAHRFRAKDSPVYDMIIVYGCAGRNPIASHPAMLKRGSVVLVDTAQYAENGRVRIQEYPPNHRAERVGIKADRFQTFRVELSSGLTSILASSLGLPTVTALCTDKVIQIDPAKGPTLANPAGGIEFSYTELIAMAKHHIIDMESFGFLWAMGEDTSRTAIIRVLTDDLGDHQQSTVESSGPTQQALLKDNAHLVIRALETHPRLAPGQPTQPSKRDADSASIYASLAESLAQWVSNSMPQRRTFNEVLASASLLRTEQRGRSTPRSELDGWVQDLATAWDKGYGTFRLAMQTAQSFQMLFEGMATELAEREDRRPNTDSPTWLGLHSASAADALQLYLGEFSRTLDPANSLSKYQSALRQMLRNHGAERRFAVRREPIGDDLRFAVTLVEKGPVARPFLVVSPSPFASDQVQWRGYEDDDDLAVWIG